MAYDYNQNLQDWKDSQDMVLEVEINNRLSRRQAQLSKASFNPAFQQMLGGLENNPARTNIRAEQLWLQDTLNARRLIGGDNEIKPQIPLKGKPMPTQKKSK